MTDQERAVLKQALEALEATHYDIGSAEKQRLEAMDAISALRAALAQQEQEPVAWTDRELQLIDGMIEVQLHHAAQCDGIANRTMAERQKGWDMERVALLRKIKSISPRREWQSLSEEEINELSHTMVKGHKSVNWLARAIEAKLKEKNQ